MLLTFGFLLCLLLIFLLLTWFWLRLNVIATVKYLILLSIPTLPIGNRLLRSASSEREADAESNQSKESEWERGDYSDISLRSYSSGSLAERMYYELGGPYEGDDLYHEGEIL